LLIVSKFLSIVYIQSEVASKFTLLEYEVITVRAMLYSGTFKVFILNFNRLSKPEVLRQKILCLIWINICDHNHP